VPETPVPERELRARLAAAQHERLPSVAAAVVRHGEVIWSDAIGLADVAGVDATPDTQYRVGSITKTFTAVALMQLREERRLDLDDELARFVPEAAHGRLTLRRMLTHLSGLQREPAGDIWETMEPPEMAQLIEELGQAELVLGPNEAHHYSNLAYSLLGEVVARASGTPYKEYVDERIIAPLGLGRTGWEPTAPVAEGYLVDPFEDVVRVEPQPDMRGTASAGQLWSTATDLGTWAAFLAEGREGVLAPEAVDRMWFPHVMWDPDAWTHGWGLGLMLFRREGGIFGGHDGGMPGHLSGAYVSKADRTGAAAVTNSGSGADMGGLAIELAEIAIAALPEEAEAWRPGDRAPDELRSVLGRWWSEGTEFVFSWREGRLQAELAQARRKQAPAVFEAIGEDVYRTVSGRERGELLRLARDDGGQVVRMYWATYPFTRTPEVFGAS
jgi:CubicO group peptidase (beta-lactamase class C family)